MRSYTTLVATLLSLLFYACSDEPVEPVREDYSARRGVSMGHDLVEETRDGKIDVLAERNDCKGGSPYAAWVAKDHMPLRATMDRRTRTMTPRIQELASQIATLQADLKFELDSEVYRQETAERSEE
jgi:hypothetical protein